MGGNNKTALGGFREVVITERVDGNANEGRKESVKDLMETFYAILNKKYKSVTKI